MFLGIPLRSLRNILLGVLLTLVVAPIIGMPYLNDDVVNRNWPQQSLGDAIDIALKLNHTWMYEQGRFFPGGMIYGVTMWDLMNSRALYATYLVMLNLLLIALVGYACWRILRSSMMGLLGAIVMGACMGIQFGYFDGLSSFGGLVPYTVVLTLLTGFIAAHILHGGSRWFVVPLVIVCGLAITSYEVSLLMLPAVLLVLWATGPSLRERVRWAWAGAPIVILAVAQLAMVLYLRSPELPLAPAYQINPGGPVGTTFFKQFSAAIPYMQQVFGDVADHGRMWLFLCLLLAVPIFLAWRPWSSARPVASMRASIALVIAGAWAWIIPSILAGLTTRWQGELTWGRGYIYLPYEYVGVTLVVIGATSILRQKLPPSWARWVIPAIVLVGLLVCAMTAGSNILGAGGYVPGAHGPDPLPAAG